MFIYWAIFLILAVGVLLNNDEAPSPTRLPFALLASVPCILMIGLRWRIGPDWEAYLEIFNYSKLLSLGQLISKSDPGYYVMQWPLHRLGLPFWVLNFICGLVFVSGLSAFCLRQPNPWLAYLIAFPYLVIVIGMSGNRQSVALGFAFFALNAFERQQLLRFAIFVGVAALFHGSVLLFLPLGLLSYTSRGIQRIMLLIVTAAMGYYFLKDTFEIYATRYSSEKIQSGGVAYRLAMNALPATIFLWFQKAFPFEEHERIFWRNVSIISLAMVLVVFVAPSSTAIDRLILYFFPLQFVVFSRLPYILGKQGSSAGQLKIMLIVYALMIQFVFLDYGKFARYYVPYVSIFQRDQ